MTDLITLEQIFSAFVRQDTLEEAALEMADLAGSYPEIVGEVKKALTQAINSSNWQAVIDAVNLSGYRVSDAAEAKQYCAELLDLFMGHITDGP